MAGCRTITISDRRPTRSVARCGRCCIISRWFSAICKDQVRKRGLEIFKRHHQMHATYAAELEIIANLEDEIHAECIAFLKAAGNVGTP